MTATSAHHDSGTGHDATPERPSGLGRVIAASMAGTFVEWYDYAVYGYFATYIAFSFFSSDDSSAALLQTFAVFGIAFAARPIGGAFAGHFGDRIGRKKTLTVLVLTTSVATAAIGLIPNYDNIGLWAPVLLVTARLAQGLAASGEYAGAGALVTEYASPRWRGALGATIELATLFGFLAGSLTATILQYTIGSEALENGAWRVPFLAALPLGLVGLYIRLKLDDSPVFKALQKSGDIAKTPLVELFRNPVYLRQMLRIMGIGASGFVSYYTILTFYPAYVGSEGLLTKSQASLCTTLVLGWMILIQIPAGALSDVIGRRRLMMSAQAAFIVFSIPLFLLMMQGGFAAVFIAQLGLGTILALVLGAQTAAYQELFPTRVRVSGVSVGQGLTAAIFGGTASYLGLWLTQKFDTPIAAVVYMCIVACLSLFTWYISTETARKTLELK
ncbi:MFS transporter [Rhodococcoides yunnanense]|uniref:MFS transporter n=1 Tax=Rhodococcoides yunnanense TaxID=278209 RepID=UPI0009342ED6|nr:MFS transporter [Rhodococcus yunnanensis]